MTPLLEVTVPEGQGWIGAGEVAAGNQIGSGGAGVQMAVLGEVVELGCPDLRLC